MDTKPGRLSGGGIRTLPEHRVDAMMRRFRIRHGRHAPRVVQVRYRVTGFRHPDTDEWVVRNPRNGHYYAMHDRRRHHEVKPTAELLKRTDVIAVEVEVTRSQGGMPTIYFTSMTAD